MVGSGYCSSSHRDDLSLSNNRNQMYAQHCIMWTHTIRHGKTSLTHKMNGSHY